MKIANLHLSYLVSVGLAVGAAQLFPSPLYGATATWGLTTGSSAWATATNWTSGTSPAKGDSVVIGDVSGTGTVIYDSTATTGTIASLTMTETSGGLNQLFMTSTNSAGLTISNALTLGATSGTVEIRIGNYSSSTQATRLYLTSGITLNSGGLLNLQVGGASDGSNPYIYGNVTLNGGVLGILAGQQSSGASQGYISGTVTMGAGTIRLSDPTYTTASAYPIRLAVSALTATGGTIYTNNSNSQLIISGNNATNTISSAVTVTGAPTLSITGNNNTIILDATGWTSLLERNTTLSSGTLTNTVQTALAGGTVSVGYLEFGSSAGYYTKLILGSNLTTTNATYVIKESYGSSGINTYGIDLGNYVLNGTSAAGWTPNVASTGTASYIISTSGTAGTLMVKSVNLSTANVLTSFGSGVTLLVTGGTNMILSGSGGGFDANSYVVYNGGSSTLVTTNRLIPNLVARQGTLLVNSDIGSGSTIYLGDSATVGQTTANKSNTVAGLTLGSGTYNSNIKGWVSTSGSATGNGRVVVTATGNAVVTGTTWLGAAFNGGDLRTSFIANTGYTLTLSGAVVTQGSSASVIFNSAQSGTVRLSSSNNDFTNISNLVICQGTLISATSGALNNASSITFGDGGNSTLASASLLAEGNQTISSALQLGLGLTGPLSGYIVGVNNSSSVTFSGNITTTSGTIRTLTVTAAAGGTATFTGSFTDQSTGTTGITKAGDGTVVIAKAWANKGNTTINAGLLQVGNGSAGSIVSATSSIASSGTLAFNLANGGIYAGVIVNDGVLEGVASGTNTLSGNITGTGAFIQAGAGKTILSGNNSYSGATTVSAGELDITGTSTNSTFSVTGGAVLGGSGTVNGTVEVTSASINGSGLNLGATTLQGTSTLSGLNIASSVTVASGTTSLSGTTHSTSTLSVSQGAILNANGTIDGSANISGLLKGSSTITSNLTLTSGTLSTGNSAGITTIVGNFTMDDSSKLVAEVSGAVAGSSYDQMKVSGNVALAGTLDLSTLSGLTLGETITLIDNTGSGTTTGYFATIITSGYTYTVTSNSNYIFTVGSTEYLLSYTSNADGNGYTNDVTLTVVPEPSTWAMILGGIGMLGFAQRQRRRMDA
ncbi:MAG: autotransporter-associated beta strand repeat-containing protein [Chthoniobacteraceae bacterium]